MQLEALKDGTVVALRPPTLDDVDAVRQFFGHLPDEDRRYLRFDMTREDVVTRLIRDAVEGRAYRVLALIDDTIVGFGVLQWSEGWHRHIGEIRTIVAPQARGQRLGGVIIGHLFNQAKSHGLEKLEIEIAGPQKRVRKTCEWLGFHIDAVLEDHIKDSEGNLHPLIVMSCSLDRVSQAMRDLYSKDDWPDG